MPFFSTSVANVNLDDVIDQINAALSTKAAAADVASMSSALALKANAADVTAMNALVQNKADKSTVTSLTNAVNNKADSSALSTKADVSSLAAKANVTDVTTALANKANIGDVTPKADQAALTSGLAQKVNVADLTTALAGKADMAAVAAKANSTDVTTKVLFIQTAVQASDTVSATVTTEQNYGTKYTLPANSVKVGQVIVLKGSGIYTTSAVVAPTQHARVRFGGVQAVSTAPVGVPLSSLQGRYTYEVQMIVRSLGATGTLECIGTLMFATSLFGVIPVIAGPSGSSGDTGNPITINTTIPNDISMSCQFSAALANNSNTIRQMLIYTMIPN